MTNTEPKRQAPFQIADVDEATKRKFRAYAMLKGMTYAELFKQLVDTLPDFQ